MVTQYHGKTMVLSWYMILKYHIIVDPFNLKSIVFDVFYPN
jgi:hypothetical protein